MFGAEGSPEYKVNLQKYRLWNVNKLVAITNKFIESIRANIHCFPNSICWLVRHIYRLLVNARKLQEKQVRLHINTRVLRGSPTIAKLIFIRVFLCRYSPYVWTW